MSRILKLVLFHAGGDDRRTYERHTMTAITIRGVWILAVILTACGAGAPESTGVAKAPLKVIEGTERADAGSEARQETDPLSPENECVVHVRQRALSIGLDRVAYDDLLLRQCGISIASPDNDDCLLQVREYATAQKLDFDAYTELLRIRCGVAP